MMAHDTRDEGATRAPRTGWRPNLTMSLLLCGLGPFWIWFALHVRARIVHDEVRELLLGDCIGLLPLAVITMCIIGFDIIFGREPAEGQDE